RTGNRRLKGENPYRDLDDFDLANAAGKLVEEILKVATRTPAERLDLTERAAYMLIACGTRLHQRRSERRVPVGCPPGNGAPSREQG
ncbi:MAG: hypothetical protein ISP90_11215, partial [Nevskia sp.]|nr:hypothetical protein [Nevskia sp.]